MAYKGGKREKAVLKYDKFFYTPIGSQDATDKQLRQEYSRLRSISRKRLERMRGTEWQESQQYKWNQEKYKPLSEVKSKAELSYLLMEVSKFVTAKTSSIKGLENQRKQSIQSMHERGYEFVNKENYKRFYDIQIFTHVNAIFR